MHAWISAAVMAAAVFLAAGCSKTEVRFEQVDGHGAAVAKSIDGQRSGSAASGGIEEQANACRTNGGVDCERLLQRRSEATTAAFGLQPWAEALMTGCMVAPTKPVVDALTRVLAGINSEGIDPRPLVPTAIDACERDLAEGCFLAASGVVYSDPAKAVELHKRACRLGATRGCAQAATIHIDHALDLDNREGERLIGIELVRGPCERGDGEACTVLAGALIDPNIPDEQRDYVEARRLVKKACDAGWPRGCNILADFLLLEIGGVKDVEGGVALFDRMCVREEADEFTEYGCSGLAYLHAGHFELLPKNPEMARRYARRACEIRARRMQHEPCTVAAEIEEDLNEAP